MKRCWPLPCPDPVLDEAVDIAVGYFEATGQAEVGDNMLHLIADSVLTAWLQGTRHKIRLANVGIVAAQLARNSSRETGKLRLDALRDLTLP